MGEAQKTWNFQKVNAKTLGQKKYLCERNRRGLCQVIQRREFRTTETSQTLRSNRHLTARSPVSAGHKRITDTLPTVNPRLRAPLPPAAVALARRPPARDRQSPGPTHGGQCLRCHYSPKPGVKSKGKTNKQKTSTGVSRQSRLYCGDTAAVRTLRRQHTGPRRAPPFTPACYRAPGSRGKFAGS